MVHRHRLDPRQRRLRAALGSAEQPRQPGLPRALSRRQNTAHRPKPPVKRELTDRGVAAERLWRNLPRRRQHRQRDRQVEA